jgi:hypothetical protein
LPRRINPPRILSVFKTSAETELRRAGADRVKEMGFDGVDLTLRPEGRVLPERAAEDQP